jgi:methane monooxygenase component C
MYSIEIETEDGEAVVFECEPGEDVITAALRQSITLLSSCRVGGCATCKAECTDGDFEMKNFSSQALPSDEEDQGLTLLCRCYPGSDLKLTVPYTHDRISFHEVKTEWSGDVISCEKVSHNVVRLVVRCNDPETGNNQKLPFLPGQYMDIEIPGTQISRYFSPATIPADDGLLEFLIKLLPNGRFSQYLLEEIIIDQKINMRGPFGVFNIHSNGLKPRYFVAGGTGLAPVLSMIRAMQEAGDPHEVKLFFGVTHQCDLFCYEELLKLAEAMPKLTLVVAVKNIEPSSGWSGAKGSVVDLFHQYLTEAKVKPDIYLCGPPGMVDAIFLVAEDCGVLKDQIYLERFTAVN